MYLNPILFPAPKSQRSSRHKVGELLWIPKFKKEEGQSSATYTSTSNKRSHRVCQSMSSLDFMRKPLGQINGNIPLRVAHSNYKRADVKDNVCSLGDLDFGFSLRTSIGHLDTRSEDASSEDSPAKVAPIFLEKKFKGSHLFNKLSKASTDIRDDFSNIDLDQSIGNRIKKSYVKEECDITIMDDENDINCDIDVLEEFPRQASTFVAPNTVRNYKLKTNEKSHLFKTLNTEIADDESSNRRTIPTRPPKKELIGHVPCLLLKPEFPSNKLLIYFHGNGEDVFLASELLVHIRNQLGVNVMAMEYPGYSVYKGEPSEERILEDTEAMYDYLIHELEFEPKNIILFGRSIGSGPATWLASRKEVGVLALMSAFTSIRGVVRDLAERFNNLENMAKVKCPAFIVHGMMDTFISYKHSQDLFRACQSKCELILPQKMDHVGFDFHGDFTRPLIHFLRRRNFYLDCEGEEPLQFPTHLFRTPATQVKA